MHFNKNDRAKLVIWAQTFPLIEMMRLCKNNTYRQYACSSICKLYRITSVIGPLGVGVRLEFAKIVYKGMRSKLIDLFLSKITINCLKNRVSEI